MALVLPRRPSSGRSGARPVCAAAAAGWGTPGPQRFGKREFAVLSVAGERVPGSRDPDAPARDGTRITVAGASSSNNCSPTGHVLCPYVRSRIHFFAETHS